MFENAAAVAQTQFDNFDPEVFESVLARVTKLPRPEISRMARRERGILHENLPPPLATTIAEALTAAGIAVAAVPASELPPASKPRNALWIEPDETGFGVPLDHRQVLERIDWSGVFAIHAAMLRDPNAPVDKPKMTVREEAATALAAPTKLVEKFPNVDVVAVSAAGKFVHFRIAQSRFAPARMPWIAAEQPLLGRFYQLLELLVARSTTAMISPTARRMVHEKPDTTHKLADHWNEEQDERRSAGYLRWLVWLAMHHERQASEA